MDLKLFIVLTAAFCCYTNLVGALRKTPKIYNALITTDENLTSSRAYPVIQPTLQETGIAHYPYYPYYPSPYVGLGYPREYVARIAPSVLLHQQFAGGVPPQYIRHPPYTGQPSFTGHPSFIGQPPFAGLPIPGQPQPNPTKQPASTNPATATGPEAKPEEKPNSKSETTIANEPSLPPALIPLQRFPYLGQRPVHVGSPYGLYPPQNPNYFNPRLHFQGEFPGFNPNPTQNFAVKLEPENDIEVTTEEKEPTTLEPTTTLPDNNIDNIKNGSKSKDSNVPDVPPPPVPAGGKA